MYLKKGFPKSFIFEPVDYYPSQVSYNTWKNAL